NGPTTAEVGTRRASRACNERRVAFAARVQVCEDGLGGENSLARSVYDNRPTAARGARWHARLGLAITLAVVLAALSLCAAASLAQAPGDAGANPFNAASYRVGEHLTYTVSFSNFPTAAHVELL